MFDILMYLFENYIHSEADIFVEQNELTDELLRAGFNQEEIYKALDWLEQLADLQHSDEIPYLNSKAESAIRIYTPEECEMLDVECRGFLMFVEQVGVIDSTTREMVIDRLFALEKPHIGLDDLKWVILMVLFNVPGKEQAYAQMEDLIFDEPGGYLH
jgi:Smg protein